MRSRKTKSSNPDSELILCACCQEMVALGRRPLFNERGRRVAKIHALERDYKGCDANPLVGPRLRSIRNGK